MATTAARGADETKWRLVWADEFDRPGLPDIKKWDYEEGMRRNKELQFYTKARTENARVADGCLVIEGRRENWDKAEYTSASLITKGKAQWTYGRFEIRAKLPTARGTWPALWLLGVNIDKVSWPKCGEIDIMEHVGHLPNTIHGTVHTDAYNHVKQTQKGGTLKLDPKAGAGEFHIYAIDWLPDRIDFRVDNQTYFTFRKESDDPAVWPFAAPHYLLLNLAIGGTWGGAQGVDDAAFPQRLVIDYVRVYAPIPAK